MKKLLTLILLFLSSLVVAQEEVIEDIYLKCVPASEEPATAAVYESLILWIRSDDTWTERVLFKESALGYVESSLVSIERRESKFGGIPIGDEEMRRIIAIERVTEVIAQRQKVSRSIAGLTLIDDDSIVWQIDRLSGVRTSVETTLVDNCTSITKGGLDQLLGEYNQKLQDAKNKVIETRKF
jgi:hypothetical protein